METWSRTSYKILQIIPASGYRAVYAHLVNAETGEFRLESDGIDFLAICRVTENEYGRDEHGLERECETFITNEIVGLQLDVTGEWMITNDAENFAGLCRDGDDITKVDYYLNVIKFKTLESKATH